MLVFIALGTWQIIRLNWKNNLILEIENSLKNSPVELNRNKIENYLKIKTSGIIDFDKQIYLYSLNDSGTCLLYTSPSPRDGLLSRMPSSA